MLSLISRKENGAPFLTSLDLSILGGCPVTAAPAGTIQCEPLGFVDATPLESSGGVGTPD